MIYKRSFITPQHPGEKSWSPSGRLAKSFPQQHRSTIALLPVARRNAQTRKKIHALQAMLPTTPCLFNPNLTSKSDGTLLNVRVICTL